MAGEFNGNRLPSPMWSEPEKANSKSASITGMIGIKVGEDGSGEARYLVIEPTNNEGE